MGDRAANSLHYGHFGGAEFDQDHNAWRFERSDAHNYTFKALTEPDIAIPACGSLARSHKHGNREATPKELRESKIKSLIKAFPELQPASDLLPELARVSEAVEETSACHDPSKGSLISFGTISDQRHDADATVVAFPSAPSGSDVRIVQVQTQRWRWNDVEDIWLEVPMINGEEAIWKGPGVPIQSILFTQRTESDYPFLAVQLMTKTLIFQSTLREGMSHGSSRLDVNLLFDIKIGETGGLPHVDIAFNPYSAKQLAVLNQAGFWSAWQWDGNKNSPLQQICHGSLRNAATSKEPRLLDDGWGRMTWIGDRSTIATCDRRKVKLFEIANKDHSELQEISVGPETGVGWIMDMKLLPSLPKHLTILTSTHIFVYQVQRDRGSELSVTNVIHIRHVQNPQDLSLRLHTAEDDGEILIFIRSSFNPIIICYLLRVSGADRLTIGDPTELEYECTEGSVPNDISDFSFSSIAIERRRSVDSANSMAARYSQQGIRFYSMTVLYKDLSLHQNMYFGNPTGSSLQIEPPSRREKNSKRAIRNPADDFIIDDDESDSTSAEELRVEPVSSYVQRQKLQATSKSGAQWTVNCEHTLRRLNDADAEDVTEMANVLEKARDWLSNAEMKDGMLIRTLCEFAEGEVTLYDVERAVQALQALQDFQPVLRMIRELDDEDQQSEPATRLGTRTLDLPPALGFLAGDDTNPLSSTHDMVVQNWLSPLSGNVPELVRSMKEVLAHRMVAEITLASLVTHLEGRTDEPLTQSQSRSKTESQVWDVPIRAHATPSSSRPTHSMSYDTSSQAWSSAPPTPTPSATPSTVTDSSHPSNFAAPEINRLSKYTSFSKRAPPPLPRALGRVLSHWKPGADPSSYNWLSISRHISQRDEEVADGEQMTEKERRRMQRRTERYVSRQRREAERSQRQQLLSSQAPEIVSASQPSHAAEDAREVSQRSRVDDGGQNIGVSQIASQIVPGTHGGRPRKKKRRSGF